MLLVDIGNTRLKWAWAAVDGSLNMVGAYYHQGIVSPNYLESIASCKITPNQILVANVSSSDWNSTIQAWSTKAFNLKPIFLRSEAEKMGLKNGYHSPKTLGVDRWLAMLGAYKAYGAPFCVIDAGSAITLDYVDASGQHVGGKILPGTQQLQEIFRHKKQFLKIQDTHSWGRSTEECLIDGTKQEVQLLVSEVTNQLAKKNVKLILTGGKAQEFLPTVPSQALIDPELLFKGMFLYSS